MKILLVIFAMLCSFNAIAKEELVLEFKTKEEKIKWMSWYVDQNGEDYSGYYVVEWNDDVWVLDTEDTDIPLLRNKKEKLSL